MADGKIFKNQDYLFIRVFIGYDLSDATAVLIKYKDPNGNEGSWAATIEDESKGIVIRTFTAGSPLNVSGKWIFWAHVTFTDGRVAPCKSFTETIYDESE